jgi:hypothetical protein
MDEKRMPNGNSHRSTPDSPGGVYKPSGRVLRLFREGSPTARQHLELFCCNEDYQNLINFFVDMWDNIADKSSSINKKYSPKSLEKEVMKKRKDVELLTELESMLAKLRGYDFLIGIYAKAISNASLFFLKCFDALLKKLNKESPEKIANTQQVAKKKDKLSFLNYTSCILNSEKKAISAIDVAIKDIAAHALNKNVVNLCSKLFSEWQEDWDFELPKDLLLLISILHENERLLNISKELLDNKEIKLVAHILVIKKEDAALRNKIYGFAKVRGCYNFLMDQINTLGAADLFCEISPVCLAPAGLMSHSATEKSAGLSEEESTLPASLQSSPFLSR